MDVTARRENFISTNFGVTFDACDRLDDYNVTFKDDQLNPPPRQNPFFDAVPGSVRVRTPPSGSGSFSSRGQCQFSKNTCRFCPTEEKKGSYDLGGFVRGV